MKDVSEQKKKSAPEAKGATAVRKFHTHSIPLDMEDIARDWEKPVVDAGIAAKASVIVRVGMLDLGAGTGSFRVREMMHRIAYPLGVHVRADVNLTDIEASCTDGKDRITEVVDLPTTGVEVKHADADDHAGFRRDAGFGYRLVPIAFDVFHIERNGVGVEFADRLRAAVNAFGVLIMFM